MREIPSQSTADSAEGSGLQSLLRLISRRRRVILIVPLILVGLAIIRVVTEEPLYAGSAQVLLNRQNLANTLQGSSSTSYQPAEFFQIARTQAALAHTRTVAERVIRNTGVTGLSPKA